jgi:cellulose synthase/poly-beta-1,6-N-acetylglucosamine synthase-like glycosyltransferase
LVTRLLNHLRIRVWVGVQRWEIPLGFGLELFFWSSVAVVVFITFGYPILLALGGLLVRRRNHVSDAEPHVSLVIAAHNEEACIERKLENSLALDYPRERLEIIVASDGSTDRTGDIVRSFADRGVILCEFTRTGKTGVQNRVVQTAQGEVVVFSDANALYRHDAIRKLVRNFADPGVACAVGQLVYKATDLGAGACEDSYWKYEKFMKRRESDLSSLVGANGSIYAVRRVNYVEIGEDLISDFVEPLALVERGHRVVYEPEAISLEDASTSHGIEFRRKVRILTRSIKGLLAMRTLLNPLRYGIFSLQLFMHKLARYFVPVFLVLGAAALTGLAAGGQYRVLFFFALGVVIGALLVGPRAQSLKGGFILRIFHLIYYYLMVNYAVVLAWLNIVRGTKMTVWVPDRKQA